MSTFCYNSLYHVTEIKQICVVNKLIKKEPLWSVDWTDSQMPSTSSGSVATRDGPAAADAKTVDGPATATVDDVAAPINIASSGVTAGGRRKAPSSPSLTRKRARKDENL